MGKITGGEEARELRAGLLGFIARTTARNYDRNMAERQQARS